MPSSTYLSFANLIAAPATLLAASTTAPGTSAENLRTPNLGKPWRSTVVTDTTIVIDWGSALTVDRVSVVKANFATMKIQQNATDSWGAPTYDSGTLTIARDPDKRLYRRWFAKPSGQFTLRYTRLLIPAQTPLDGAPYFEVAALQAGLFTALPRTPLRTYRRGVQSPKVVAEADLGKWRVAYRSGEPFSEQHYRRQAAIAAITPGAGDEWGAWMDIDRKIEQAGTFCYLVDTWGGDVTGTTTRSGVWFMQQTNVTSWELDGDKAEDDWDLAEVVA